MPALRRATARGRIRPAAVSSGFSLIELVVVVGITAIVIAIAIPMYSRITNTTKVSAAKNALVTALKECQIKYTRTGSHTMGQVGYTGINSPIQSLMSPPSGFAFKAAEDPSDLRGITEESPAIDLNGPDFKDTSCFGIALVAPYAWGSPATFGIGYFPAVSETVKTCYLDGLGRWPEGCYWIHNNREMDRPYTMGIW